MKWIFMASLLLVGCNGSDPAPGNDGDDDDASSGDDDDDQPTDTDTDTEPTDTAPEPIEIDCALIPAEPTAYRPVPGARGYHDVEFDADGLIIGATSGFNSDLLKVNYDGDIQVWVPGVRTVQQFAWLPDGDLAVASDTNGIVRVASNGGTSIINGNIQPYGLLLGPDEMLYAADQSEIWRVDPTSGEATQLMARGVLASGHPRVINFSLDYTKMFIGTYTGSQGRIYVVDVDADFNIVSAPTVFATGVGSGAYHDTLGVDICGYLYVADYSSSAMYRIDPDGQVITLLQAQGFLAQEYGHGMTWGTGKDGWLDQAIYVTQPYNGNSVLEVVIDVPPRGWTKGYAINLP